MPALPLLRSARLLSICLSIWVPLAAASSAGAQTPGGEPPAEPTIESPEPAVESPPALVALATPPAPAQLGLGLAERSAWLQLQALQLREAELWRERDQRSFAWPGVAVGFGIPTFAVLVPIGSILMADSSSEYCYSEVGPGGFQQTCSGKDKHEFRVGTTLLVFGLSALAATVWGIIRIRQIRKAGFVNDRELRTTSESRTLLENILGQRFGP